MSLEVRAFTLVVPAGTTAAAPFVLDCTFPARQVDSITWRVPPGPRGVMGWQIQNSGLRILPTAPDAWIVTDDEKDTWDLEDAITSGSWQLAGYNTGANNHSVYVRFNVSLPGTGANAGNTLILPNSSLSGA